MTSYTSVHLLHVLLDQEHVPGVLNTVFDGLSRNVPPQELGLDPLLMCNATADEAIVRIVQLGNPADQLSDMASHTALLQQCTSWFMLGYPGKSSALINVY